MIAHSHRFGLVLAAFSLAATPAFAEGGRWTQDEYATQPQEGLVWAKAVAASSFKSSSFKPEGALGKPDVFPKADVSARIWSPKKTSSDEDWIEVSFAETNTQQIRIFETTRPGCISKVVDAASGDVLHEEKVVNALHRFTGARVLYVNLSAPRLLSKIKIFVRPKDAGFSSPGIDAVALVPASDAAPAPAPAATPAPGVTTGHWSTDDYTGKGVDMGGVAWPKAGTASSQQGSKQSPAGCVGAPRIWPKHKPGIPFKGGAWAPKDMNSPKEWLKLEFPSTNTAEIHVFETYLPGQVWKVEVNGEQVYGEAIKKGAYKRFNQRAQVFWLKFSAPIAVTSVKLWFKPQVDSVRPGIDTVGLVPAN